MEIRRRLTDAAEFIHKKIPYGSHMMKPKKDWMQTKPEKDCDVVMVMSDKVSISTISWLENRILCNIPQIKITSKLKATNGSFRFHLQGTFEGLLKGAEGMRLIKRTKNTYGGDLKEFSLAELPLFQDVEDEGGFFTTQERQGIVLFILNSLRTTSKEDVEGITVREGQAIVPKLMSRGIIRSLYPLHHYEKLKALKSKWVPGFLRNQPIDDVKDYFGAHIGFYFAWLGHYTMALTVPAVLGLLFWSYSHNNDGLVAFAFLNVVWATVWLEAWKRRSAEISYSWGTMDAHLHTFLEPRPQFKGDLKLCKVTGRIERHYPSWKRNAFRYLISLPLVLISVYVSFRVMLIFLEFEDICTEFIESKMHLPIFAKAPKMVIAIPISIFDKWYTKLALWLTKKENYRSEEEHEKQLIMKLLVVRFINSFLSLFYIAFYLQDLTRLKEHLAALLFTKQISGNLKESVVPYLKKRLHQAKLSVKLFGSLEPSGGKAKKNSKKEKYSDVESDEDDASFPILKAGISTRKTSQEQEEPSGMTSDPAKDRQISQAVIEGHMAKYEGTYKDYLEVFIQFGYVTLFSCVFPLAAVFALVTSIIEIRSDAFKFCYVFRRPFGQRSQGIGIWQDAMELMGVISIIVNCALIGLSGKINDVYPDITPTQTILIIIVLEHLLIAIKYGISYAIPDIPEWVEEKLARKEFLRCEALKARSSGST